MVAGAAVLIVFGLLVLGSVLHLIRQVWRGDIQVESTSHGRQLFGGREKNSDSS